MSVNGNWTTGLSHVNTEEDSKPKDVIEFLKEQSVDVLNCPYLNPDLNSIENIYPT